MSLLSVRGLTKDFGGNRAVDGVSFDLRPGELLALIGPNGAGKSTTFNMVGGQLPASAGSVKLNGAELLGLPSRRIAQLGVGRTFQIAATFSSLTVRENVQMALLAHHRKVFSFWRSAARQYAAEADALLGQVGMREQAARPCSELAYGDVKRVELAMSLAAAPTLLLMDEPTAGMAPAERNALVGLVKQLVTERNLAVLFTEHSMDVVFAYADRVIVLARGSLIAQGSVDEVRRDAKVQEVYFGTGKTFGAHAQEAGPA
ncbi:ABC transporter ATP-binding protein [Parapusillimonas granuli]|mgnify:CR=1 FL=1|uniref:ABC transporter ATP-binding protein n=1 Tax=Parapusillimonas granuli TaxID=380911 RepID=A0A853FVF6_9BURK|nr:ABC transporter ATP-binding protein [Parapusillimonas granuli]MBB5213759.1 branched-chain amino acid transport system ATP-binding protein [Parapusillimonas granuli]MEB2398835.1 ABC transporter ATP-binding protein [Alcaligenaceae bacterium]NYT48593.1 ABC transporter ATP-binding protein [Parapusillimonas granuli]